MHWIATLITGGIFAGLTAGGLLASDQGWGLPGELDQPASVRKESLSGKLRGRSSIGYFSGRRQRSHYGGGFHGGK
jgi:hypothetical protein